jgi:two-component system, chemotaxis family, sensor kinase Cph1
VSLPLNTGTALQRSEDVQLKLAARITRCDEELSFMSQTLKHEPAVDPALDSVKELQDLKAAIDEHSIVAITDPQGRITYVNDKFCAISKYSRDDLLGQNHRIINSGYHPKEFFKEMWAEISKGHVWTNEIKNKAKDGSFYWVHTTIVPFKNSQGQIYQYVSIRTDITERKKAEEALAEKNKELETIVYVASHDLRSPLVNIQGFSKELESTCKRIQTLLKDNGNTLASRNELETILSQEVPEAIEYIMLGVTKMDALLAGFLKFSRLGRAAIKIERLDMTKLLSNIVQTTDFQIKKAGAKVQVNSLSDCLGDRIQVDQVFSNLIDNALKYAHPERPCVIHISSEQKEKESVYRVKDNGIGIAKDHQVKIFEIFHRLNPSATAGEGLGLTIAQKSLEKQHGRIWVESEVGKGSEFFIALPSV